MGHALQLYIVHRMKALPKIPPLAGLDNFLGVARLACGTGALARESFWVAQRLQRCDSAYVTNHSISPLSFRTGFSREESAFPSWRIPPFLILADALLSLRQTDSLTTPAPFRGGITTAQHISTGSARDRDSARPARHSANVCVGADVSSAQAERKLGSTLTAAQEDVTTREGLDCVGRDWEGPTFSRAAKPF